MWSVIETENLNISPVKSKKAYQQIVETFIKLIAENKIEYGDKLYNEPELMKMLNVSRPTLREALRVMEFLGIVTVAPRKGITINSPNDTVSYFPLVYIMMFEKTSNLELFELRRAIETDMASAAAMRRSEEHCQKLSSITALGQDSINADYVTFARIDYDFHMAIVEASGNSLCIKLMKTLVVVMEKLMEDIIRGLPVEDRAETMLFHVDICNAIIGGNASEARHLMEKHLERPYRTLKNMSLH